MPREAFYESVSRYFDRAAEFCALYDMPAFDPDYPTPPLEHYEPLIREFFKPRPLI